MNAFCKIFIKNSHTLSLIYLNVGPGFICEASYRVVNTGAHHHNYHTSILAGEPFMRVSTIFSAYSIRGVSMLQRKFSDPKFICIRFRIQKTFSIFQCKTVEHTCTFSKHGFVFLICVSPSTPIPIPTANPPISFSRSAFASKLCYKHKHKRNTTEWNRRSQFGGTHIILVHSNRAPMIFYTISLALVLSQSAQNI